MNHYEAIVRVRVPYPAEAEFGTVRFFFVQSEGTPVSVWDAVRVSFDQRVDLDPTWVDLEFVELLGLRLVSQDRHPDHQSSHGWLVGPPPGRL